MKHKSDIQDKLRRLQDKDVYTLMSSLRDTGIIVPRQAENILSIPVTNNK